MGFFVKSKKINMNFYVALYILMLSNSLHCKLTFIVHSPWFISESEMYFTHC